MCYLGRPPARPQQPLVCWGRDLLQRPLPGASWLLAVCACPRACLCCPGGGDAPLDSKLLSAHPHKAFRVPLSGPALLRCSRLGTLSPVAAPSFLPLRNLSRWVDAPLGVDKLSSARHRLLRRLLLLAGPSPGLFWLPALSLRARARSLCPGSFRTATMHLTGTDHP